MSSGESRWKQRREDSSVTPNLRERLDGRHNMEESVVEVGMRGLVGGGGRAESETKALGRSKGCG